MVKGVQEPSFQGHGSWSSIDFQFFVSCQCLTFGFSGNRAHTLAEGSQFLRVSRMCSSSLSLFSLASQLYNKFPSSEMWQKLLYYNRHTTAANQLGIGIIIKFVKYLYSAVQFGAIFKFMLDIV